MTMIDTMNKKETPLETLMRVCAHVAEVRGDIELAREFRHASCKEALSPRARKLFDAESKYY